MTALPPCIVLAAQAYSVPVASIERVIDHASGPGLGVMKIDLRWLPILQRAGFDPEEVRSNACMNIAAGAWILAWAGAARSSPRGPEQDKPVSPPATGFTGSLGACVAHAARQYHLPELLYRAILLTEGGRIGHISRNTNGTYDMGPAQVNSMHLPELARMGITREQIINDGCLNIHIGAWVLAGALGGHTPDNAAEFWRRVGNYNSSTPKYNVAYQRKVWKNVQIAAHSQTSPPS